ncbi:MAG: Rieske 2Fe-2S domain-containing protein [Proteobacteria bacterium]|nr:Rieske 2Fe-2S domain-containing protein [Desulfobacula sp.]MBU3947180.1 Rieske 2Fe-2S domain-containing protein [Pseudomonadota bacterium]
MKIKSSKRNFFQRILGLPVTSEPKDSTCWSYSDGKLILDLKKVPELKNPGGAIRLEGRDLPERILVFFGEDQQYYVFKNRCSHVGHRRLDPVPGTNTVQCCSISKSTYDFDGKKIFGPAPHSVIKYSAVVDGDKLTATIS